jgi:hypothetical protein
VSLFTKAKNLIVRSELDIGVDEEDYDTIRNCFGEVYKHGEGFRIDYELQWDSGGVMSLVDSPMIGVLGATEQCLVSTGYHTPYVEVETKKPDPIVWDCLYCDTTNIILEDPSCRACGAPQSRSRGKIHERIAVNT